MSSFNLQTTIGNLPNIISSLDNLGTINTQNLSAQTLNNGSNSFSVSLSVGTYIVSYSVNIYQSLTTAQQFKSIECCLTTGSSLVRDQTYQVFDYVMPVNTVNSDFISCAKTFTMQITTAGTYNLLANVVFGTGASFYCNVYFQTTRII